MREVANRMFWVSGGTMVVSSCLVMLERAPQVVVFVSLVALASSSIAKGVISRETRANFTWQFLTSTLTLISILYLYRMIKLDQFL